MTRGNPTTMKFNLEKETKGALRYQQVDDTGLAKTIEAGAEVGTLYLRKSAFNGADFPRSIKVTIEAA